MLRDMVKDDEKKFKNYDKNWKYYIKPTIKHYRQSLDTSFSSASTTYSGGSGVVEPREFRYQIETRKRDALFLIEIQSPLE